MYASLPAEIQLNIVSQSQELRDLQNIDKHHRSLTHHIITSKLNHYLQRNTPVISLFSPNNKEANIKNFYNVEYQIHEQYTHFTITSLDHKENILTQDINTKPAVSLNQQNHMDLILNEDQTTTKISLSILLNNQSYDTSIRLNKNHTYSSKFQNGIKSQWELEQGEIEPAKGGYDFEINHNYSLNFQNGFKVDNLEILKVLEQDGGMIVRY